MRVVTSIVVVGLLLTTPAWAQHKAPTSVGPDPSSPDYHELLLDIGEKGTVYHQIETIKTETRDGAAKVTRTDAGYRNDFTLGDDGYVVKKTLTRTSITMPDGQVIDSKSTAPEAVMVRSLIGSFSELTFIADDSLTPVRLENWPELRERSKATVLSLIRASGEKTSTDFEQSFAKIYDNLIGRMSSEQAADLYLKADSFMAIAHNVGLERNKPVITESTVIVPLGNYPLAMRSALTLTEWKPEANSARLSYDVGPTPEGMKAFLTEFMPRFLKEAGAPENVLKEIDTSLKNDPKSSFDMSTHCDYDVAIDNGLVRKGGCRQTSTFHLLGEQFSKVETYEFSESFTVPN
ncbi:hypothetical protein [Asticcacaulis excentricus]|uniref:Lipoprotein n=1 Tax=Asticcacaulis excentricus (strain ATCC 15261 / DSM 4724 / KCTC 12464 / NCIMB 9791 / VKM B-1370 / CB 48) TaxID=573065 RepID=E8RKL5_ASTEC|nr:hypothetical protein [Asticcacaulis excentricus]ADU13549.1 hypothetical protein Astex_1886 [Asticcacaulis excentricus CB 48]